MSWLNNSLNTIKGQLTNLAQEVLADTAGPGDDEYRGDEVNTKTALELLTETQLLKEQLDKACEDKDREIAALRKQVTTLKSRKISEDEGNFDTGASTRHNERTKSSHASEEQNVEDSWCWEPTSSEEATPAEATPTAKTGDMVDVPLASGSSSNVAADVGKLNAMIEQLEEQNGELRNSLEELDAQHDQAMQDVLAHKGQLVKQLTELKAAQGDRLVAHELAVARLQKQLEEEQQRQAAATAAHQELQQRVEAQSKELQQGVLELADMQQLLEKRGADNAELIERVRQAEAEREKLQRQLDELAKQVKEKKTSESSNSSMTGKHSEDEFIVVRNADAAGSSSDPDPDADADTDATVPPTKEKLRDKLVSLEARIAELSAANAKLQDGELERQLASSVLDEQLAELETRLRISESEKEQLQLELQRKLQQLMLQNQELKLSAEADQETHANDLELQLGALRDENRKLRQELDASIAQAKFRQAIAEEKQEITDLDLDTELDEQATAGRKDPHKLRPLLEALLAENTDQALERTHRLLNERWQRLETVEQRMVELQDQQLIAEHDKKTLEADISQYILQCDELMKNNELLLNELDKFKRNKLETIEEHHEETIAQLEQQLEEAQAQLQQQQQQLQRQQQQLQQQEQQQQQQQQQQLQQQYDETLTVARNREQLQQVEQLLAQQTDELQQTRAHVGDLLAQLEQFKVLLGEAQAESSEVQQLQAVQELERDAQLQEVHEVQAQLLYTENQLRESTQSGNELKEQLEQLRQEQHTEMQHQQEVLRELQVELKQRLAQNELLQSEAQRMQAKLQQVQLELEQCSQERQQQIEQLQAQKECPNQQLEQLRAELQQPLETLNNEKLELIKALQQKHTENTQYYAEIQRLQPLEQQLSEMSREREKLCDQINFLKEKSDILTGNLLTEQNNQRQLQQKQLEAQEQQLTVQRDLERLRAHLVEIEEMHTQETLELQRELEESRSKQSALQQEVSKSSTAYTSASIRANQQAETLQAQHALLLQQRDELLVKLGQCDDRELKQQAALTNLQCALEQFQNDKEHDIELGMQRMRRELQQQLERETALRNDVAALQQQLSDANQGLRAAARLSDQLEAGQQTIAVLRDEVDTLKDANLKLEQRLSSSESSQTDKIDKSLIKSLLIGYVVSGHAGDKQQVLRMISSVLDFNAQEADKVGLNKPQNSWLGSILGSASNAVSSPGTGNDNLLQAFVQFLEKESQPQSNTQTRPTLLSMGKQLEASPTSSVSTASPTDARGGGGAAAAAGEGAIATIPAVANVVRAAVGGGEQEGARGTTTATPVTPTPPMQSLLMSSNEFVPTRNSSSILKDILSDS